MNFIPDTYCSKNRDRGIRIGGPPEHVNENCVVKHVRAKIF